MLVILTGVALRIESPRATVFCDDQARACALAEDIANGRWETGGLNNSGRFRNLPGYPYILAAVWRVWGDPRALLGFTIGANVVAFAAAAYLARRWVGPAAAWWATAFFSASPWAIHYCRWIFAQHLLFSAALIVYACLWLWLCRGRRWASLGVVLGLTLLVQIHLAGIALALAVGIVVAIAYWRSRASRALRLSVVPLLLGAMLALASVAPYLAARHFRAPVNDRLGYLNVWRAPAGALMSVSGLYWQLVFLPDGYAPFVQTLGWRHWPYQCAMVVPVLLLVSGMVAGVRYLRRRGLPGQDRLNAELRNEMPLDSASAAAPALLSPLGLVLSLSLLIPPAFMLLGIKTSPNYLPLWYPLPFVLIGWAVARLRHRWLAPAFVLVLIVELAFFTEHLRYINQKGGVPESALDRSLAGLQADLAALAAEVHAREIWLEYAGDSDIMHEGTAYLFRKAHWTAPSPVPGTSSAVETDDHSDRVLIRYLPPWKGPMLVIPLHPTEELPKNAFRVYPWTGPQQYDGYIERRPR